MSLEELPGGVLVLILELLVPQRLEEERDEDEFECDGEPWREAEDAILRAAVAKYGEGNWTRLATLLFRRTPAACKVRWQALNHNSSSLSSSPSLREAESLLSSVSDVFPVALWTCSRLRALSCKRGGLVDVFFRSLVIDRLLLPCHVSDSISGRYRGAEAFARRYWVGVALQRAIPRLPARCQSWAQAALACSNQCLGISGARSRASGCTEIGADTNGSCLAVPLSSFWAECAECRVAHLAKTCPLCSNPQLALIKSRGRSHFGFLQQPSASSQRICGFGSRWCGTGSGLGFGFVAEGGGASCLVRYQSCGRCELRWLVANCSVCAVRCAPRGENGSGECLGCRRYICGGKKCGQRMHPKQASTLRYFRGAGGAQSTAPYSYGWWCRECSGRIQ